MIGLPLCLTCLGEGVVTTGDGHVQRCDCDGATEVRMTLQGDGDKLRPYRNKGQGIGSKFNWDRRDGRKLK